MNQDLSGSPSQDNSTNPCFEPPGTIEVPDDPTCPDYEKIPEDEKETIDLKLESAKNSADEIYEESLTKIEDTKAQAQAAYDAAMRKHDLAMKQLNTKIEIAKKQLRLDYKKCLRDAIPKQCPSTDDPTCDKVAVCVTQLKESLAKQDIEFQKESQKIKQDKSAAIYALNKAMELYDAEKCVAEAIKNNAYLAAELVRRKALSKALEGIE